MLQSLSVNKFMTFYFFFGIKNCLLVDNIKLPGLLPSRYWWPQRRSSLSSKLSWRQETLGMRLRMKWLIWKYLNSETFLLQASCKVASFPLVLDLMHEYYVISFPDAFPFLIWRSFCFVAHFHISTSQNLPGNGIGILFFTLRTHENNGKLKLSSKNKTHIYSLLVTFDVHVCSNWKK